ncbi:DUF4189 domain-containing protein [Lysobacter pythonis]|uniref:DUF4189 domain-containing protein n=1 Tax=Solilutibacter pythonis TaxID=2483112 RepID=A0A3M2HTK1_9GAMM|nr:DUF4189 domain-containing protein [Lysobacter pythonis]
MSKNRVLITFVCLLPISGLSQSSPSGPCPPGAVPIPGQGRCGSPAEAAAINKSGSGSSAPAYTEVWENRFGAVAIDYSSGKGGAVEDQKNLSGARRLALNRCGLSTCKIVASIRNGCQSTAWGGGVATVGYGDSEQEATEDALSRCVAKGGGQCKPTYAGCSLPVRVR